MRRANWKRLTILTAISVGLVGAGALAVRANPIAIGPNLSPTQVSGQSGGGQSTPDCGTISAAPNHVLNLAGDIPTMELNLQATGGEPTLLVEGPGGQRWCSRSMDGSSVKVSGYWDAGTYRIYVGDRSGSQHSYTLSIAQ